MADTPQPRTLIPSLVSIMMPAYNAEKYIGCAIESILAQTYTNWELIIINDGSKDSTAEKAVAYTDPRILIFNQPNGGESVARNHALSRSKGEFIAFLDADDRFLPHHLQRAIEYLQNHHEHHAVYTDGMYINPDGSEIEPLSKRRRGPFTGIIFEQLVRASDVFGPPICVVLRHSEVLRNQLSFDQRIVIGPDWDFMTRFAENNPFGYIDEITCQYRLHPNSISVSTDQARRRLYLALCREKAIQLKGFPTCSEAIRNFVFYDLLINLLPGYPERRQAVTNWNQFLNLSDKEQARLLRLMASSAILENGQPAFIKQWLKNAQTLNPSDLRIFLLRVVFSMSPALCQKLLKQKRQSIG